MIQIRNRIRIRIPRSGCGSGKLQKHNSIKNQKTVASSKEKQTRLKPKPVLATWAWVLFLAVREAERGTRVGVTIS
jgi:hypothetical protein